MILFLIFTSMSFSISQNSAIDLKFKYKHVWPTLTVRYGLFVSATCFPCHALYSLCCSRGQKNLPWNIINHWWVSKFDKRCLLSNLWAAPWCWFVSRLALNYHQNAWDTRVNLIDMWWQNGKKEKQKPAALVQMVYMVIEYCNMLNAINISVMCIRIL